MSGSLSMSLYVSDWHENEVRRYTIGNKNGIVVPGGNGKRESIELIQLPDLSLRR